MLKQCPAAVCLGQMHFSEQQDLLALLQGKRWVLTVAQPGAGLSFGVAQGGLEWPAERSSCMWIALQICVPAVPAGRCLVRGPRCRGGTEEGAEVTGAHVRCRSRSEVRGHRRQVCFSPAAAEEAALCPWSDMLSFLRLLDLMCDMRYGQHLCGWGHRQSFVLQGAAPTARAVGDTQYYALGS